MPSNSAFIAQPRAPYSARNAVIASSAESPNIVRKVSSIGGPTMCAARSPSGTAAPTCSSACRKLATMPSAESVSVPSRSKITSCGVPVTPADDARRIAS